MWRMKYVRFSTVTPKLRNMTIRYICYIYIFIYHLGLFEIDDELTLFYYTKIMSIRAKITLSNIWISEEDINQSEKWSTT